LGITVTLKSTIQQTVSAKSQKSQKASGKFEPMLSWSHYCELLKLGDHPAQSFYEQEAILLKGSTISYLGQMRSQGGYASSNNPIEKKG
jgi:hypothetical protein